MQLLSINVALPRTLLIEGKPVRTGIYKEPVNGPVPLGCLGLLGDDQADHTVHGGEHQAVYGYPFEHYAYWQEYLGAAPLAFGTFGENFTTSGLLETEVDIGDVFQIGSAFIQATAPRLPCFKFGHKIGRPDILKDFLQSGRCGFYFRVLREGVVTGGAPIEPVRKASHGISIRRALGLQKLGEGDADELRRALEIENLNPLLRKDFEQRLNKLTGLS